MSLTRARKQRIIDSHTSLSTKLNDLAVNFRRKLELLSQQFGSEAIEPLVPSTEAIFSLAEENLNLIQSLETEVDLLKEEVGQVQDVLLSKQSQCDTLRARLYEEDNTPVSPLPIDHSHIELLQQKLESYRKEIEKLKAAKAAALKPKLETPRGTMEKIELFSSLRPFSGTDNEYTVRQYLTQLNRLATLAHWDDQTKKTILLLKLTGKAEQVAEQEKWEEVESFDKIKEKLTEHFCVLTTGTKVRDNFGNLRMEKSETVRNYASRTKELSRKYFDSIGMKELTPEAEKQILIQFINGLQPYLRNYMENIDIIDFQTAVKKATAREAYFEARNEGPNPNFDDLNKKFEALSMEVREGFSKIKHPYKYPHNTQKNHNKPQYFYNHRQSRSPHPNRNNNNNNNNRSYSNDRRQNRFGRRNRSFNRSEGCKCDHFGNRNYDHPGSYRNNNRGRQQSRNHTPKGRHESRSPSPKGRHESRSPSPRGRSQNHKQEN